MALPIRSDSSRYTYADLFTWPEDGRWELIDGIPYDMSPSPTLTHERIGMALIKQFSDYLDGHTCELFSAPFDVRLPKPGQDGMTADTVVQPDLFVVCEPDKLDEHGCVGAPSLVIEIISPSTMCKDLREKYVVYQRAGVPEYWIIDPKKKTLQIHTLDETGSYGTPIVYLAGESAPVSVLPGLEIDLTRIFAER